MVLNWRYIEIKFGRLTNYPNFRINSDLRNKLVLNLECTVLKLESLVSIPKLEPS